MKSQPLTLLGILAMIALAPSAAAESDLVEDVVAGVENTYIAVVEPHVDCWMPASGPGYSWIYNDVLPYPDRLLPRSYLPPCV